MFKLVNLRGDIKFVFYSGLILSVFLYPFVDERRGSGMNSLKSISFSQNMNEHMQIYCRTKKKKENNSSFVYVHFVSTLFCFYPVTINKKTIIFSMLNANI